MSDRIILRGIRVHGYHGVLPEERRDGQPFLVDVALAVDTRPAAREDDLSRTVDYAALAKVVADVVGSNPCDLIETVADRVATRCLADPHVGGVEVTVHKPEAPVGVPFEDIAVTINRSRT